MKKIVLVFLCCICINFNFAQNKIIDSLLVVLKTQKDYVQNIVTLNEICTEYQKNNVKKVIFYNQKILNLSQKNNYELGYGFYLLQSSFINLHKNKFKQSLSDALKAKDIFKKNKNTSNYLTSIISATHSYVQLSEHEKGKALLSKNLPLAIKNKKNETIVDFYRLIGDNCRYQDSIIKSLFYYKKAIPYLSSKKTKAKSILFEKLSDECAILKQYKNALIYIDESIENREIRYRFFGESKKALYLNYIQDYKTSLPISLKNYDTIVKYKMTIDWHYNLILYNIAYSYYNLGNYNASIPYINKVIDSKNTISEYKVETLALLSSIYFNRNKKIKAREFINKALIIHDSLYSKGESIYLYPTLVKTEEALGNYKRALYYFKKQTYFDIYNITKRNNEMVFQQQTDFDVSLKDSNIRELKIAQLQKTVENKKQRENLLYVSAALILALLSTFFYIRNNRAIKNKNKIIELTNIKLENEKQLTQKSLVEKETLLKEIHHRVKNNMQLVMSLLNIQAQEVNNNISDFVAVSQSRILSMSLIHENLYQTNNLSQVDFKEYVDNLTNSILHAYSHANTNITLQLDIEKVYFDIQKAIPLGLIINELVNNAYKHAFINNQKGLISLQLIRKNEKYELEVRDNGVGIQKKESAKKTLGLQLVEELVFQIDGLLKIGNTNGLQYNIQF